MDWLNHPWVPDIGAGAILAGFILALLTGRLRTNTAVQELRADRDERLKAMKAQYVESIEARQALADSWREAYQVTEDARAEMSKTLDRMEKQQESIERAIVILTRHIAEGSEDVRQRASGTSTD